MRTQLKKSINPKTTANLCIRALCEHENSWHPCGGAINYELVPTIPQSHYAYWIRIMSLIKQSGLNMDIVSKTEKIDELLDFIEDNLPDPDDEASNESDVFSFRESFNAVSNSVIWVLTVICVIVVN